MVGALEEPSWGWEGLVGLGGYLVGVGAPLGDVEGRHLDSGRGGLVVYGDLAGCRLLGVLELSGFFILSRCSIMWALFLRRH